MLAKNSSTEYFIVSNRRQRLWKVSRLSWYVEHFNRDAIFHLSRGLADDALRSCSPNYCKDFFPPFQLFQRKRQKKACDYPEKKKHKCQATSEVYPEVISILCNDWLLHVELHILCSSDSKEHKFFIWVPLPDVMKMLFLSQWIFVILH